MIIINHKNSGNIIKLLMIVLTLAIFSCTKKDIIGVDPYAGGKQALGVKFTTDLPDPEVGTQGGQVTFKVKGLLTYQGKFKFLVNEQEAEIIALTDSSIKVKVPITASTGGTSVLLDGQTFFGPNLTINGKVNIDASYKVVTGTTGVFGSSGPVFDILQLANNNYFLGGSFTDFDTKATTALPINNLLQIGAQGDYVTSLSFGKGTNGPVFNINRLPNGNYLIAGLFGTVGKRKGINNITTLNSNGTIDTTIIPVINPTPLDVRKNVDTVPTFNGGVDGLIRKTFVNNNLITVVGNFKNYGRYFYDRSTYDSKVLDITKMNQLIRLKMDGSMDSTFNFNPATKQSDVGGNGSISDGFMQADGKVVIVGSFSTFNGATVNHIARINLDGTLDKNFNTGGGANDNITSITYNTTTQKIMIAGTFTSFDGTTAAGVAMLSSDGSLDKSFVFNNLTGGVPNYAGQLNSGKIIISGGFTKYGNVIRQGFMVLNPNGTLSADQNNTGAFQGQIYKFVETTSSLGNPAVILIGNITKFDNKKVGNILRVEIKP
ncbi:MAG: hypothetical protein JWO58_3310 [Chitinophagaceae bacterium]|nr:hypothetical protein [Chitinophagaceae bacterium]